MHGRQTRVGIESPDPPEVGALIDELDAGQAALYPAAAWPPLARAALGEPNVVFVVARNDRGEALGCGAIVLNPRYGEIDRLFVRPQHRREGLGRALLLALMQAAAGRGCRQLRLATGLRQPHALAMYRMAGFRHCDPYGGRAPDPLSVCMERTLEPSGVAPATAPPVP